MSHEAVHIGQQGDKRLTLLYTSGNTHLVVEGVLSICFLAYRDSFINISIYICTVHFLSSIRVRCLISPVCYWYSLEAIWPSLELLEHVKQHLRRPVWINADILQGPNGDNAVVDAKGFLDTVTSFFPDVTLSLGWTTGWHPDKYNKGKDRKFTAYLAWSIFFVS